METAPVEEGITAGKREPDYFVRFSLGQRIEHLVLMLSFTVLAVTGLAQRFYTAGWAEWVILSLGGIEYTRLVHRAFALLFTLQVAYHLGYVVYALFWRHARPSMLPTLQDARDAVTTLRYSFGFTDRRPEFGCFDYRQKFEYLGIMFGSAIIIFSGFFLAFPLLVTQLFPGQFVAAAKEFHGNEATLAVLVVVIWHFYDTIFKPGIFPGDFSIFSGKISRERALEEHSLEYAELGATRGGVETPATTPPEKPVSDSSAEKPASND